MRRRTFLGGTAIVYAALAVLALSAPASAQEFEARALPPDEILTILYMAGLDPVGKPTRSGPNYVIRAIEGGNREVQVEIDASSGDILSRMPAATASRIPPASHRTRSRGGTDTAPSIVDEDDSPSSRFYRSLSPGAPPPPGESNATGPQRRGGPMQREKDGDASAHLNLNIIIDEPGRDGVSPTPERPPRRAVPAASLKSSPNPADRTAAMPPKPEPLPKPRPDPTFELVPRPYPSAAESKQQQPASLPMPPIPPRSGNAARSRPRDGTMQPDEDRDASAPSKPKANPDEPNRDGVLPPPPERSLRRAAPIVPPKPLDRTAAVPPKPEPLPKPRPDVHIEALPSPSPPVVSTRRPVSAPMPLTPQSLSNAAPPPRGGTTQPNKNSSASAPSKPNVIMADPVPDNIPPEPENASGDDLHSPR
jgi:hypothetical protein